MSHHDALVNRNRFAIFSVIYQCYCMTTAVQLIYPTVKVVSAATSHVSVSLCQPKQQRTAVVISNADRGHPAILLRLLCPNHSERSVSHGRHRATPSQAPPIADVSLFKSPTNSSNSSLGDNCPTKRLRRSFTIVSPSPPRSAAIEEAKQSCYQKARLGVDGVISLLPERRISIQSTTHVSRTP